MKGVELIADWIGTGAVINVLLDEDARIDVLVSPFARHVIVIPAQPRPAYINQLLPVQARLLAHL